MEKEFRCKGISLANYLITHGSTLIRNENEDGDVVFVFKHDETIDDNVASWEFMLNRCMF